MSNSERPKTRRLHESPYDKEDLPLGETRGLVALMPLGESHHRFAFLSDSFILVDSEADTFLSSALRFSYL